MMIKGQLIIQHANAYDTTSALDRQCMHHRSLGVTAIAVGNSSTLAD